ncbi:hypothetical protein K466DRAFT_593401 [Polyporus arcularius HHB13444]|uniref:DUF6533 domain-containing protein n=1 Tax=Polyporus arcularius HHB13444 TaxID=1314778 RepID=A0A5C3PYC9_9APHY|nr:hypothetical protein K466DRAFT_593401 [Polyporus arcularius HHB13444]
MDPLQHAAEYYATAMRVDAALTLAGFTILYYDYALTVASEIEWYWSPPSFSLSSCLFALIRYYGLLGPIPVFFEYFPVDISEAVSAVHFAIDANTLNQALQMCRKLQLYHQTYAIISQVIVGFYLVLRTYALYNRSKRVLVVLLVSYIGGVIQGLVTILTSPSVLTNNTSLGFNTPGGCNLALTNEQGVHLALTWSAMLWYDSCIIALTFWKAVQVRRDVAGGLLAVILRDGTLYYAILVAVTVASILTFLLTPSNSPLKGTATTLTNVLSVTLTCRLMLNLRDPSLLTRRHVDDTTRHGAWSTVQFSSRMISFRAETPMDVDTIEMSESTGTDSRV